MSKRARALQILRDRRDFGQGWVTGLELLQAGCGTRYGARVHELREQGHVIECDTSERDSEGDVISRYRLTFDAQRDRPAPVIPIVSPTLEEPQGALFEAA